MIYVDRDRQTLEGRSIQPSESWRKRAKTKTSSLETTFPKHRIDESFYREQTVRRALGKLFGDKCAHCESSLLNTEWEVEHFRPKGAVHEAPMHPGYYWLAYRWTNLYPSCKACNQSRKDYGDFDEPKEEPAAGKATQFPLEDESGRVYSHDKDAQLKDERPVLLDPCSKVDDHEQRFLFTCDGRVETRHPEDQRASTTRRILNLNRTDLVKLRRQAAARWAMLESMRADLMRQGFELQEEKMSSVYQELARQVRTEPERFPLPTDPRPVDTGEA